MIDWERLRELRDEIGAGDFDEVVELFFSEADEAIARLATDRGSRALAEDLHELKGAALNLGFSTLAAICQKGERLAGLGAPGADADAVRKAYAEARAAFAGGIATAFAA